MISDDLSQRKGFYDSDLLSILFLEDNFYLLIYVCARSSLLCRLFSRCSGWGLLSRCGAWASHCCLWLPLLWSMGSRHMVFSSCDTQAQQLQLPGSRAQVQ